MSSFLTNRDNIETFFSVLSTLNLETIHQWQITLLIFAAVGGALKIFLNLMSEGMEYWPVTAFFTLFFGAFIYVYCKNYMEEYVHPEKI